jgi:CubicO group peptidase (beta-lactamase class C family)
MTEPVDPVPLTVLRDVRGAVAAAVRDSLDRGEELGIQVAVVRGGRTVAHVVGGYADTGRRTPVSADSLFPIFSATKGVVAAACLALLDTAAVTLDEPLVRVWPTLGTAGKERLSLRHILTHTAGIPQMPDDTTVEAMCDWNRMVTAVAALEPLWEPGRQVAYHAYTYGWLAGEVLRRVDGSGRGVDAIVRGLVGDQARADGIHLGVPAEREHHVVDLVAMAARGRPDAALFRRAIPGHLDTTPEVYGRSDVRRACLPGAGAVGTALGLARVYDRLSRAGGWTARGTRVWDERHDAVMGRAVPRGLGFWVSGSHRSPQPVPLDGGPGRFGHPGAGGSIAWADAELGAGFAVLRNRLTPDGWRDDSMRRIAGAAIAAASTQERRDG